MKKIFLCVLIVLALFAFGWLLQKNTSKGLVLPDFRLLQAIFEKEHHALALALSDDQKQEGKRLKKNLAQLKKNIRDLENEIEENQMVQAEVKERICELEGIYLSSQEKGKLQRKRQARNAELEIRRQKISHRLELLQQQRKEQEVRKKNAEKKLYDLEYNYTIEKRRYQHRYKSGSYSYFEFKDLCGRYESERQDSSSAIEDIDKSIIMLQDEEAELNTRLKQTAAIDKQQTALTRKSASEQLTELNHKYRKLRNKTEDLQIELIRQKRMLTRSAKKHRLEKKEIVVSVPPEVSRDYALAEAYLFLNAFPSRNQAKRLVRHLRNMQKKKIEMGSLEDLINYLQNDDPPLKKCVESLDFERRFEALLHQYKLQRSPLKNKLLNVSPQNGAVVKNIISIIPASSK